MWIKTPSQRDCGTCGVLVEKWLLHNNLGHTVAETIFCPVCYPDLEEIFHTPEVAVNAA
ncbi:MAG: hypothetical protein ACE5MM_09590 [Nitrospiraceae bacterium]